VWTPPRVSVFLERGRQILEECQRCRYSRWTARRVSCYTWSSRETIGVVLGNFFEKELSPAMLKFRHSLVVLPLKAFYMFLNK
jgi:hypothetical protein